MTKIIILCVAFSILFTGFGATQVRQASGRCHIATHRVTGKNKLFSLICRCDGNREMLGRSIRFFDKNTPDTVAQERLTVSCIEKQKARMARICGHQGSAAYRRVASQVLRTCMNRRPKNPSPEGRRPFTFSSNQCVAEFRELDEDRKEALVVCACTQRPGYIVHPGVIQFITDNSPNGKDREQKLLEQCTAEFIPSLSDSCSREQERFDLRTAQAFNVCCKRLRVKFPKSKLACQATVPDDVSLLDLTFV